MLNVKNPPGWLPKSADTKPNLSFSGSFWYLYLKDKFFFINLQLDLNFFASEIYNFLENEKYKYLLLVNACLPLLSIETIKKFYTKCYEIKKPAFAVFETDNYYIVNNSSPINFDYQLKTINTKKVEKLREFAHVFYFFEKEYFKKHGWYWDWNDVEYITIPKGIEMVDIDTEHDFEMAEIYWKGLNHK